MQYQVLKTVDIFRINGFNTGRMLRKFRFGAFFSFRVSDVSSHKWWSKSYDPVKCICVENDRFF